MKTAHLDVIALWEALDAKRRERDISWRQVAREMAIQPSTLTRMQKYACPSAEGLIRMLTWLGVPTFGQFVVWGNRTERKG